MLLKRLAALCFALASASLLTLTLIVQSYRIVDASVGRIEYSAESISEIALLVAFILIHISLRQRSLIVNLGFVLLIIPIALRGLIACLFLVDQVTGLFLTRLVFPLYTVSQSLTLVEIIGLTIWAIGLWNDGGVSRGTAMAFLAIPIVIFINSFLTLPILWGTHFIEFITAQNILSALLFLLPAAFLAFDRSESLQTDETRT